MLTNCNQNVEVRKIVEAKESVYKNEKGHAPLVWTCGKNAGKRSDKADIRDYM